MAEVFASGPASVLVRLANSRDRPESSRRRLSFGTVDTTVTNPPSTRASSSAESVRLRGDKNSHPPAQLLRARRRVRLSELSGRRPGKL